MEHFNAKAETFGARAFQRQAADSQYGMAYLSHVNKAAGVSGVKTRIDICARLGSDRL